MKFADALKDFRDKDVTVTTREDEYCGVLTEVGEDYIKVNDGKSNCLINLAFIESVTDQ